MPEDDATLSAASAGSVEKCPACGGPSLTNDERLAIQWVVGEALSVDGVSIQATLRVLLDRTRDASE